MKTMSVATRKLILTLHVITTMGWLGSAAAYIPIASYALSNQNANTIKATIQIMSLVANVIVLPVAFASLITGIILSLGTKWGLVRHLWIFFKLVFTALAVFMLVAYTFELNHAVAIAEKGMLSNEDLNVLQSPIHLIHPIGGLLIVISAAILSVYKPKGMTRYGWRKQMETKKNTESYTNPRWSKGMGIATACLLLFTAVLFVVV
ncbi:hypothetical protein [Saccharibacillus endophyticus]|uniref:DUF2269 domain-containing protein n=1 Tax=Saccharibacillus endophyticus TaxID=2060666 RepID=A0ABQ1ZYX7_9BACL|nr:hypothetical protein [Saccharibacillus endophyticus]GGH80777.1 hypothetical protein GCM10007362_29610 [Saccharibacillus endophyticus]